MTELLLALGAFVGLMLVGVPLYAAIGVVSVGMFALDGEPVVTLAQIMVERVASPGLIPVPFFVVTAFIMQRSGIAKLLVDAAESWFGAIRGSAALVCVAAAAFFATISGSSVTTALSIGTILLPLMVERGYPRSFAVGAIASSGTLGILLPPSVAMIIYGLVSDASVPRMFLAGLVPALLQALLIGSYILYRARRDNYPKGEPINWRRLWRANLAALPAFIIPGVIFSSIYGGLATVTEAAALSVVAAIAVALGYGRIRLIELPKIFADGIITAAGISFIVGGSMMFGHWVVQSGFPQQMVRLVTIADLRPWQFLLAANIVMLLLGMFFEGIIITLLVVPLILPVLKTLHIDVVHFAVVLIVNMEIGLLHPPVGLNLFTMQMISGAPIDEVVRGVWPFLLLMMLLLLIVTYVPEVSLFLPRLVYGK